jgi:hypothetical protein
VSAENQWSHIVIGFQIRAGKGAHLILKNREHALVVPVKNTSSEVFFCYYRLMLQPMVLIFVPVAILFALVHFFALELSLYWHYWWFDIVMHFWGGTLIALGVMALTSFRRVTIRPTYWLVFTITFVMVIVWEIFEWQAGIVDPVQEWQDTFLDMALGFAGSGIGFVTLKQLVK